MKGLSALQNVDCPKVMEDIKSAYHLFTVWVDGAKRDTILKKLGNAGIGVAVNYRAIHQLRYFRKTFGYKKGDFPNAEDIGDRTISLPFYPELSDIEISYIVEGLKEMVL
jgi:UDP-4-amino-4-deoxy-L-arabinose-oxoglutarate aminotransferase